MKAHAVPIEVVLPDELVGLAIGKVNSFSLLSTIPEFMVFRVDRILNRLKMSLVS